MAIVKSGWLHRQSTILRRWKKNWFDLWSNGRLVFYNDQQRRDMEDEIHMRVDCINIRNANACRDLTPPDGKSKDSLLQIVCRDGRVISICADSADDALAWSMALQDARVNTIWRECTTSSTLCSTDGLLGRWTAVCSCLHLSLSRALHFRC
ncbi:pleckstrin homology domain-containing family B member 2 isoform X2 [Myxocyprinus asiaticus]|uniref:pleckstrin homology domain-containing family B member 2 isoform X2 n=1 Tax=Myxocyprinus asiaticus TaxID=70543 RepID=UPI0022226DC0|nr:pleckstrin homology domain-containing family B member 2 isoform X2 [Myxocyprinus asiaticus]